jgi:hypothetical protein
LNLHLFFSFERDVALLHRPAGMPHPMAAERPSSDPPAESHLQNRGDSSLLEYVALKHQQCGNVAVSTLCTLFLDKAEWLCQATGQS